MTPRTRKIVYVVTYELFAVFLVGVGLSLVLGKPLIDTGGFAILSSLIAMAWNYIYTSGFEYWEARRAVKGRSTLLRICHAIGFELGLLLVLLPTMAWWLDLGLVEAFFYNIPYSLMFLGYTYLFNLGFDGIFGLPESAR